MESERIKAAKKGKVHYDGSACRKCGGTLRYVSTGVCVHCARETNRASQARIKDLIRQAKENASAA